MSTETCRLVRPETKILWHIYQGLGFVAASTLSVTIAAIDRTCFTAVSFILNSVKRYMYILNILRPDGSAVKINIRGSSYVMHT